MSNCEIFEWNGWDQEISEDSIRAKFPPPGYRVSSRKYRNNESHPPGAARAGLIFVIEGRCKCNFGRDDEMSVILDSGQYIKFPEGRYRIEPLNGEDAEIVFVWNVLKLFGEIFPNKTGNSS